MIKNIINSKYFPFQILTITIFIGLIVPVLIKDGIFIDGQQYAVISKNLAHGLGTFWKPFAFATWYKSGSNLFLEHPPLVFGIQSLFFRIFGDSLYTERIYSFTTAIVSFLMISSIWKLISESDEQKKLSWLPVLLWIVIPICFWSYQNNIQENTMGIFTLTAVFFAIKSVKQKKYSLINILLSAVSVFLATFCKGVPGLFPIVTITLYWIFYKNISFTKSVFYTFILCFIPFAFYMILMLLIPEANESLSFYFSERLLGRIGVEPTVENRFWIIFKLLTEIIVPALLVAVLLLILKLRLIFKMSKNTGKLNNEEVDYNPQFIENATEMMSLKFFSKEKVKDALFFISIGLSGSLPLVLTMVQRGFYFSASLPFFAIGFALIATPSLIFYFNKFKTGKVFKILRILSLTILAVVIWFSAMQIGKTGRHKNILSDVYTFGYIIPENSIVKVEPQTYDKDWSFHFYMVRYFNICFDGSENDHEFFIINKESSNVALNGWTKVEIETKEYDLYVKPK